MIVYVDLFMILNFFFDLFLLLSTTSFFKRYIKWYRLIFGAVLGLLSTLVLFYSISNIMLLLFQGVISLLMIIATFGFSDILTLGKQLAIFYFHSLILGGFLTLLKQHFSYSNAIWLFILILSPIFLYLYVKMMKSEKSKIKLHYKIELFLNSKTTLHLNAYLDTGNQLYEPYHHHPVVLVKEKLIPIKKIKKEHILLIPYETISETSLIKCIKIDKMRIDSTREYFDVFVGLCGNKVNLGNYDMLLHVDYKEEIK